MLHPQLVKADGAGYQPVTSCTEELAPSRGREIGALEIREGKTILFFVLKFQSTEE